MTTALILVIILLALVGVPIFVAMAAFAILGEVGMHPEMGTTQAFSVCIAHVFEALAGPTAATLATLPLFVFLGYVMAEAKTAQRLVRAADAWLGWFPGGLAIVTIVVCAFFTTVTGASGVTIVAIGGLILPSLLKQGYPKRFSLGLVTGTGSIGLLFPPALPLVVYGIVYGITSQGLADEGGGGGAMKLADFSVEAFMFAGIAPGFILITVMACYAVWKAMQAKVPRSRFGGDDLVKVTLTALPELLLPFILLVPIAKGWLLIPEAAAFAAVYVLVIECVVFRDVKLPQLWKIARESMTLVGSIFIIIVAATALTQYFIDARVAESLYAWMGKYIDNKWTFLLALNLLLLVVGCLMDIFSAILVVVPLIAPAAKIYGIDPYHLGVIFLLNLEIGYLTPPVGLNLFITSFRFKTPMVDVYRAALPFIGVMLVALGIVTYVPLLVPELVKVMRFAEKKSATVDLDEAPPSGPVLDGGLAAEIRWNDGGVWKPERCEQPEIKDDPLAYAECTAMFKLWPRCDGLEELDKLECRDKVLAGEDPFTPDGGATAADAAPAPGAPTAPPGAVDAGAR